MAIRNVTMRNALATVYKNAGAYGALFSADPGTAGNATNELTGGSPAYARISCGWGTVATSSVTSAAMAFNVPSGSTVAFFGLTTSGTAATADVQDSVALTSQSFASQGTYTVTATYTQS